MRAGAIAPNEAKASPTLPLNAVAALSSERAEEVIAVNSAMENLYYIRLDVHKKTISYRLKDSSGRIYTRTEIPATVI
jgi:hypothetical protein